MNVNVKSEISIRQSIDLENAKKIFSNKNNAILFLKEKGIKINEKDKNINVYEVIVNNWDYHVDKNIIRKIYLNSRKYLSFESSFEKLRNTIEDWNKLFGTEDIQWPFMPNSFDQWIAKINRSNEHTTSEKNKLVTEGVVKFRIIKEINTLRNDFIENQFISVNENVIPTLANNKGVDYYIDGIKFDQKVSRSVGREFVKKYGENYTEIIENDPIKLIESLYINQDEARFDYDYRFYVVFDNMDFKSIKNINEKLVLNKTLKIYDVIFDYAHKEGPVQKYQTKAMLLFV
jgi:hypothetical protein